MMNKITFITLTLFVLGCITKGNAQITLPFVEDFESATVGTYQTNQTPIPGLSYWSYETNGPTGRLRTSAGAGFANSGTNAITLDADPSGAVIINYLIGEFDMTNYIGSSTPMLLDFAYSHHGEENSPNDSVWVRGSSSDAWIGIYDLYANRPASGSYANVTKIDLSAALASGGQVFSATTQIRFGQEDNFPATSPTGSDGFSFDDVSIYLDLPMAMPSSASICSAGDSTMLTVSLDSGYVHMWYDSLSGGNLLATADTLWTGPLVGGTTYFVAATSPGSAQNVGMLDNSAGGGNFTFMPDGLAFTVNQMISIDSVTVYPNDTGIVSVRILDGIGGAVITSANVYVEPVSANAPVRIALGFNLMPGNYAMDADGTTTNGLHRNNGGAVYPYSLPEVDITGPINALGGFYYFFYNWQVSPIIVGPRIPADVTVDTVTVNITGIDEFCLGSSTTLDAGNAGSTILWSTSDTTQTIDVTIAGDYSVLVTNASGCVGMDTLTVTNPSPAMAMPNAVAPLCSVGDSTMLTVSLDSSYTHMWYDSLTGGNLLATADTLWTGPLGAATTYFVAAGALSTQNVGKLDNSGSGGSYTAFQDGLVFTVYDMMIIDSMTVYPNDTGDVSIRILDGGLVVDSIGVYVEPVSSGAAVRIAVGLSVMPGNYTIDAIGTTTNGLFRTNGAAVYPYTLPSVEITAAINALGGFYYFFYNWQVSVGCIGPRTPVNVTLDPVNVAIAGIDNFCAGSSTTLDAANAGSTILWSTTESTQTINVTTPGDYSVIVTNASSCVGMDTFTVIENPNPTATDSVTNVLCNGDSTGTAMINATGAGTLVIDWGGINPSMLPVGTFTYTVTDSNSCILMDSVTITEASAIIPAATDNGNGTATASATGGTVAGAYSFLWDASTGGQTTATATGLTSGTYCATITDDNGCSDTACVTILITGLQDVSSQVGNFKVYPNPTTGNVFVELDLETQTDVQLDIYNTTGQNVMTRQLNGQADRIELNIGDLPAGVYLMRFAVENEVTTKKLILQR
ncbi:MAG: T9SS type A sorting domain-containing protein [Aureispira sp.]|nr:T9SS type A sorting domain-containing protein [Aureispira sp.]